MHVTIATPMYGGVCSGAFTKSLIRTLSVLSQQGIKVSFIDLYNESLITRARNTLTHIFLNSDSDYLLFIDADQTFRPQDILRMLKSDKDVIGAPVPMKTINWEKVRLAALAEKKDLEKFSGLYNVNLLPNKIEPGAQIPVAEPLEVLYIGTGMLLIKREVFEKLSNSVESYIYDGSDLPADNILSGKTVVKDYWRTAIVNNRLLSEDYNFCSLWRGIGGSIYVDLLAKVVHMGTHAFAGEILDPDSIKRADTPAVDAPTDRPKTKKK